MKQRKIGQSDCHNHNQNGERLNNFDVIVKHLGEKYIKNLSNIDRINGWVRREFPFHIFDKWHNYGINTTQMLNVATKKTTDN